MLVMLISVSYDTVVSNKHEERTRHYYVNFQHVVVEQDALGLRQLSPKLISTHVITKYGKLHYSMLIRVVESCTMVLIQ